MRHIALAIVLCSCGPEPVPVAPVPVPVGAAATADAVCLHLAELRCAEGTDLSCEVVVQRILRSGRIPFDASCVLRSTNQTEVRTCQAIRCR